MAILTRRNLMLGGAGACAADGILRFLPPSSANAAEKYEITRSDEDWRGRLTPAQYAVLRLGETEQPFTSPLDREKRAGTYLCGGCNSALFSSKTKFDSRTGWPSFWKPLDTAIRTSPDNSQGLRRTQVDCRRCGGHIGHVFGDGPRPTGLRYCLNGVALTFAAAVS